MARVRFAHVVLSILAAGPLVLAGCGSSESPNPAKAEPAETAEPVARVPDRPANTSGVTLILEYHRISREEARWDRSIVRFRSDLERLYRMGFRPVVVSEYLSGKFSLPPGASPVAITFDDSDISQFRLLEDGSLDPDSAVGVWLDFAKEHPDFPVRATFYVLPPTPWGQPNALAKKLELLRGWGSELGSHTLSHRNLRKLSKAEVDQELRGSIAQIRSWGFEPATIALPFGISPKDKSALNGFKGALLVGAGPAMPPSAEAFDPYRIPRIQAIEGEFGINYWLDRVESGKVKPYVAP